MRRQPSKRSATAPRSTVISKPISEPRWIPVSLIALACLILLAVFSKEISDTDFWWHLKTGEYIAQSHTLPDPDPFAFTTAGAAQAYPGEGAVRHFNLTHEWLAQVLIYLVYRIAGFGGVVLARALLLLAVCGLVGLMAYWRSGQFYRALAAALIAGTIVIPFAVDRPFLVTFVLLATILAILERNQARWLWSLPLVMLIWANCHGGFILGWIAMAAFCAQALFRRLRGRPDSGDVRLWTVSAISILVSDVNPNGFRAIAVLLTYRKSSLQASLIEWKPPSLWPPGPFAVLLVVTALVLIWKFRKVRMSDWLLFLAFAGAGLMAGRNTFLIGLVAPVWLAAYLPGKGRLIARAPIALRMAGAGVLVAVLISVIVMGQGFQLRAAGWAVPEGVADFLIENRIRQRTLNTYEYGGYLIWKLWPQEHVFIDGRALSETVFADYQRMVANAGDPTGKSLAQLLDQYGIEVVVMNPFEYTTGILYMLAPALADPRGLDWKLVYVSIDGLIFMRHPSPDMTVLDPSQIMEAMKSGCQLHIDHDPKFAGCASNLGQMFSVNGDREEAIRWLGIYLAHAPQGDVKARQEYQRLLGQASK